MFRSDEKYGDYGSTALKFNYDNKCGANMRAKFQVIKTDETMG